MHKTHHFDIRNTKIFCGGGTTPSPDSTPLGAFDGSTPGGAGSLSDGLDTRPCKILDPRLSTSRRPATSCGTSGHVENVADVLLVFDFLCTVRCTACLGFAVQLVFAGRLTIHSAG